MNILQKIFTDHYEEIKYTLHPRDTEMENIEKMIHCGDPSFGGAMYHCPHCGNFKYVPFHCHSRFCPSCGNKYSMERTTSMTFKLINVKHRHCVFTIDENLRDFFLKERSLLDCLFHSVASVISRMFFELNKSKNFTPGFIMVLHTFGRDLKWNPHIHCLISEGGLSDDGLWRNVHHFNYSFLRSAFRTALLNEMHQRLGDPFKQIKSLCYSSHKKGFYVYAKPSSCDPETAIKYIGRYLGRPVIATSRIDKYDGSMVTFHYNRHEDDKYIQETIPVMAACMHATAKQTSSSIKSFPNRNVPFYATLTIGGMLFFLLLVMIRWNVPSAGIKWSFWNFILTISVFPSKNYMRDLCPDLAESVLLHNFLCFYGIIPS